MTRLDANNKEPEFLRCFREARIERIDKTDIGVRPTKYITLLDTNENINDRK